VGLYPVDKAARPVVTPLRQDAPVAVDRDTRLGVLAFGDSITNGGGELQWGVALQSWALWTARALGLPFTSFAVDGARVGDIVGRQLVAAREWSARPDALYDLGALHIGVNDVRALDWDAGAYVRDLATVVGYLAERCDRTVLLTIPLDLGRPRPDRARIDAANAAIEAEARRVGATLVDLRGLRGRRVLMADHVHPTAFGQIAIAERTLDALASAGTEPLIRPRALIAYEETRTGRLRGDLTYAYRHAKLTATTFRHRARARGAGDLRNTPPTAGDPGEPIDKEGRPHPV
jgi:lysophospholipase L1-like esterase